MQLPPFSVLASWPKPNYEQPSEVRGNGLLILTGIFFPIALIMVALRTFTRLRISRSFGVDDVLLLVAIPPTFAIAVLTVLAVESWGWDRHIWDVRPPLITKGLKLAVAMECLFGLAVSCYKLSLLVLTRRIMATGTGILRHVATFGMFIVFAECLIFAIAVIFTCSPPSAYWTLSLQPQKCINERVHLTIGGAINTFSDFLVFFLPLPTVFKLKIPTRQKVALTFLFGTGLIVCLAGVLRIYYTWRATSTFDRTWEAYGLWITAVIELYLGMICAAIPACRPFFSRYVPNLLGPSFLSNSKHQQGRQEEYDMIGSPHGKSNSEGVKNKSEDEESRSERVQRTSSEVG